MDLLVKIYRTVRLLATTLIAGLAFVTAKSVALVARLTFVTQRTIRSGGDSFFQFNNFQFDFFVHVFSPHFFNVCTVLTAPKSLPKLLRSYSSFPKQFPVVGSVQ